MTVGRRGIYVVVVENRSVRKVPKCNIQLCATEVRENESNNSENGKQ